MTPIESPTEDSQVCPAWPDSNCLADSPKRVSEGDYCTQAPVEHCRWWMEFDGGLFAVVHRYRNWLHSGKVLYRHVCLKILIPVPELEQLRPEYNKPFGTILKFIKEKRLFGIDLEDSLAFAIKR